MEPASRQRSAASQGRPIQIVTNFFRLNRTPAGNVGLYFIEFTPDVEDNNRSLRDTLIKGAKDAIEAQIGEFMKLGTNIAALRIKQEPFSAFAKGFENEEYTLNVRLVGTIDNSKPEQFKMYSNVILKKMLKELHLLQVTRLPKYYDRTQTCQVPAHQLEVWRGYTAVFQHHYDQMLLNLDFASKIIRNMTALDMIREIEASGPRNLGQALEKSMEGLIVMASYGNYMCYRIEGIDTQENPNSTFQGREGPVSYKNYYKTHHNVNIKDMRQPLIITTINRGQKTIKLIPELCRLTGISDEMRSDFRVMSDIAVYTRLQPQERLTTSQTVANRLGGREMSAITNKFSLGINPEPITVDAIRLPMEKIKVGGNQSIDLDDKGGFNLKGSILTPVNIDTWAVLSTQRDQEDRDKLVKTLQNKARQIGVTMGAPYQLDYNPKSLPNLVSALNRPPGGRPAPQIGVILLPGNMRDRYHEIKEASCLTSGIPTQVVMGNSVRNPKRFDSIMSKLVLQIAAKTGSHLWALAPTENLLMKTMVIGIDVFHDTVKKSQSVVGFVASIHPAFTQYYNSVKLQPRSGEEIASSVSGCLREALVAFFENTKRRFMPEHVIVYRDGVADSQIEAVRIFEVEGMKKVINSFEDYHPNFTYIIVNKKTNAKLYAPSNRGIGNPLPGTVVNSVVVPDPNSFYLIAHSVTQGMASPTLYRVIENTCPVRETDVMTYAKLAFKLCYMYYNWSGGIKVPAPTMMAHKLAFIVGQSVHEDYLQSIKLQPWFY
ncbi:unnamed protein product [Blepharisma stoltei]|uniref:Uncharacterized protein n=1 Tax=Blepharisma stoltei TaxID=1481888 RepID=A0AAU9JA18_9CILI|nr:unnamed protein product [Blepharisma stoltei]